VFQTFVGNFCSGSHKQLVKDASEIDEDEDFHPNSKKLVRSSQNLMMQAKRPA